MIDIEVEAFDEAQTITALQMTDDCNLTVHTYNEALAKEIYGRMKDYVGLMAFWIMKIEEKQIALFLF
ncbi:nucleotidyltransferase substrate binding protein [Thermosyntropha lipolytica]|uniref:nucleotidyltransferase substrate binding protein n=1 Tax=Thermosyntropha lipolytica TaxID=54294 RepID=UPI000934911D|nr:nucleotidyltransferase substrate binding protein [Thermosyntropha lipolytica]